MIKYIYILGCIALVLGSVKVTKVLMKKIKLNRWIIGSMAPFVLIIPSLLFKNMSMIVWNLLSIIFCVMCIMFFEITRYKLENNEIKGILNYKKK
ncbi:MAG: hypothetical protein ACREVX_08680 [Clostridium sp.]|uniref:hypothetical protein n=1 Tax=Clostridium sp. TaxID=1506 RepID=UPI003D6D3703